MSIASWLFLFALIALVAFLILWPLARKSSALPQENEEDLSHLGRLRRESDALLRTIRDMDQEMERGNLEIQDHLRTRAHYVRQAALLLREIEGREQVLDEEIRRAVIRLRRTTDNESPRSLETIRQQDERGE